MPQIHRLTLTFKDPLLEREYNSSMLPRTRQQGRFAILIGTILYLIIGILDQWLFSPNDIAQIWTIRITALCVPWTVLLVSMTPYFERHAYWLLASIGFAGGLGLIASQMLMPIESAAYFYPSLVLMTFYTYMFVGTRFVYALIVDLTLLLLYNVVFGVLHDYPLSVMVSHDFFLISANLIGGAAGYLTEYHRRSLFAQRYRNQVLLHAVEKQKEQAEHAYRQKSHFLAAASHDLRQPIHALMMFLESMRHTRSDESRTELLDKAERSTTVLSNMLSELFGLSQLESGGVSAKHSRVNISECLCQIVHESFDSAAAAGVSISCRCPKPLWVETDRMLVERIVRNLVGNVIRHCPDSDMLLSAQRQGRCVRICVWDNGPGIAAEHLPTLFDEYVQINNPERDINKGLGLGLNIVQRLATLLGTEVSVTSREGHGSRFCFLLPRAEAPQQTGDDTPPSDKGHDAMLGLFILVIDDDANNLNAISEMLFGWGCEVLVAESAQQALEELKRDQHQKPDLILADYRLREGKTGIEAIESIRGLYSEHIAALIMTGDVSIDITRQANDIDTEVLIKPVSLTQFRSKLREVERQIRN